MSCSPESAWITEPAPKKSNALKKAWFIKWNNAVLYEDNPQIKTIYPSWLQVEYAITFLISSWVIAIVAAKNAVVPPINKIKSNVKGDNSNIGEHLKIKKTPAVTNVAAWINADTGVGMR